MWCIFIIKNKLVTEASEIFGGSGGCLGCLRLALQGGSSSTARCRWAPVPALAKTLYVHADDVGLSGEQTPFRELTRPLDNPLGHMV